MIRKDENGNLYALMTIPLDSCLEGGMYQNKVALNDELICKIAENFDPALCYPIVVSAVRYKGDNRAKKTFSHEERQGLLYATVLDGGHRVAAKKLRREKGATGNGVNTIDAKVYFDLTHDQMIALASKFDKTSVRKKFTDGMAAKHQIKHLKYGEYYDLVEYLDNRHSAITSAVVFFEKEYQKLGQETFDTNIGMYTDIFGRDTKENIVQGNKFIIYQDTYQAMVEILNKFPTKSHEEIGKPVKGKRDTLIEMVKKQNKRDNKRYGTNDKSVTLEKIVTEWELAISE